MFDATPSKYPNSVEVTADTATLPEPSDTRALEAVKSLVVIEDTAPAIFATRRASTAVMLVALVTVLEEIVPICVETVVLKLASSPRAAASSLRVFRASGALSTMFATAVPTKAVVAI